MLSITIPPHEYYDEIHNTFGSTKETTLQLEHSLVSLSKWESKWKKPFLSKEKKTAEECLDYIRCMTITQNVDPAVYMGITSQIIERVNNYIEDSMTATWFRKDESGRPSREVITSEVIYYWMVAQNIPFECQKWHLNRLLTLIRVCNVKNSPSKKMDKQAIMERNKALNASRKSKSRAKHRR